MNDCLRAPQSHSRDWQRANACTVMVGPMLLMTRWVIPVGRRVVVRPDAAVLAVARLHRLRRRLRERSSRRCLLRVRHRLGGNLTTVTNTLGVVRKGDIITYTVVITNNGSSAVNNILLYAPIPSGTTYVAGSATGGSYFGSLALGPLATLAGVVWSGSLAPGESHTLIYAVRAQISDHQRAEGVRGQRGHRHRVEQHCGSRGAAHLPADCGEAIIGCPSAGQGGPVLPRAYRAFL